ncbi:MAG: hypothetical protein SVX43_15595 [Cyanobacteriota bacterium]|nr:hypothetical protein [Cyanobacteriota bacterium]
MGQQMSASAITVLMGLQLCSSWGVERPTFTHSHRLQVRCCAIAAMQPTLWANSYNPPDRGAPDRTQGSGSRT